jgi:hypothetical protein
VAIMLRMKRSGRWGDNVMVDSGRFTTDTDNVDDG